MPVFLADIPLIWRNHKVPSPRNRAALIALHTLVSSVSAPARWRSGRDAPAMPQPSERPKILLVRADGLGDVVMTTAAFQAVRAHFPESHITLVTAPIAREMVDPLPWFDEMLTADLRAMSLGETAAFGKRLRERQFDLGVDFRGDARSVWLLVHAGARIRVGHRFAGLSPLLTHPLHLGPMHQVEEALAVAGTLGAPAGSFRPRLLVSPAGDQEAQAWLEASGLPPRGGFAVLHVAPARPARRWTPDRFAAVADRIQQRLGLRPVLVGTRADQGYIETVAAAARLPVLSAAGRTSLAGLIALLARASLFFGVDSGPMHVAAALDVPVVALFGPMSPAINGPYGLRARAIHKRFHCPGCAHNVCRARGVNCMTSISVDEAWHAIQTLMAASEPP